MWHDRGQKLTHVTTMSWKDCGQNVKVFWHRFWTETHTYDFGILVWQKESARGWDFWNLLGLGKKLCVSCNPKFFTKNIPTLKFFMSFQLLININYAWNPIFWKKRIQFFFTHLPYFFRTISGNKNSFLGLILICLWYKSSIMTSQWWMV